MSEFDTVANDYNNLMDKNLAMFGGDHPYYGQYKASTTQRVAKKIGVKPRKILEFGCGIGRNIKYLKEAFPNCKISGYDPSRQSIEIAKSQSSADALYSEIADINEGDLFDIIFVSGVFHHIPLEERSNASREISKLVKKGGIIIIFEHNPMNFVTKKIVDACPFDQDAILLRRADLLNITQWTDLKLVTHKYCLFAPAQLRILSPLDRLLHWLPLGAQHYVVYKK